MPPTSISLRDGEVAKCSFAAKVKKQEGIAVITNQRCAWGATGAVGNQYEANWADVTEHKVGQG